MVSFEEYIKKNPELKRVDRDLQERKYIHYEEKRQKLIEEAKLKRKEIIKEKQNTKKVQKSTSAEYILEQGSTMLKGEREKLQNMKNQQIAELKNII